MTEPILIILITYLLIAALTYIGHVIYYLSNNTLDDHSVNDATARAVMWPIVIPAILFLLAIRSYHDRLKKH
jgi:heme/copper-type cytochrome/quinol oxidase subunit 2